MRRYQIFLIAFTTLLWSCTEEELGPSQIETRDMAAFESIYIESEGNVRIVNSDVYQVEVLANSRLLEDVETSVNNNTLTIKLHGNHKNITTLEYLVRTPNVTFIDSKLVGSLYATEGLVSEELEYHHKGVGKAIFFDLEVNDLSVDLIGVGDVELSGTANSAIYQLSGVGNITREDLQTNDAEINLDGVGDVHIGVSETLKANIEGVGKIYYRGNPMIDANEATRDKMVNTTRTQ